MADEQLTEACLRLRIGHGTRADADRFFAHLHSVLSDCLPETEKSQFMVEVTLPILPVLQRTLDAGPVGDMAFICGDRGQPLSKETFGNEFRVACNAAGVPGSAHGVRKIAATRAANAGATVAQPSDLRLD